MKKQISFSAYWKVMCVLYLIAALICAILLAFIPLQYYKKETDFRFWYYLTEACVLLILYALTFALIMQKKKKFLKLCKDDNAAALLVIGTKALRKKAKWSADQPLCCSFDFKSAEDATEFLQNKRCGTAKKQKRLFFSPVSAKDLRLLQNKTVIVQREFIPYFQPCFSDASFAQRGNKFILEGEEKSPSLTD